MDDARSEAVGTTEKPCSFRRNLLEREFPINHFGTWLHGLVDSVNRNEVLDGTVCSKPGKDGILPFFVRLFGDTRKL